MTVTELSGEMKSGLRLRRSSLRRLFSVAEEIIQDTFQAHHELLVARDADTTITDALGSLSLIHSFTHSWDGFRF